MLQFKQNHLSIIEGEEAAVGELCESCECV